MIIYHKLLPCQQLYFIDLGHRNGWTGIPTELVSKPQVKLRNTWAIELDAKVGSSEFRWSHLMCIFWKTKLFRENVVWKSHYKAVVQAILPIHECFADSENALPGKNLKLRFWWTRNNLFNSQESHRSQVPIPGMISDGLSFLCHCLEQYAAWLCNQVHWYFKIQLFNLADIDFQEELQQLGTNKLLRKNSLIRWKKMLLSASA